MRIKALVKQLKDEYATERDLSYYYDRLCSDFERLGDHNTAARYEHLAYKADRKALDLLKAITVIEERVS